MGENKMTENHEQKVALITGSSSGIGKGIVLRLAEDGYDVAINARHEGVLQKTAKEIERTGRRALVLPGDVSEYTVCKNLIHDTVDGLGRLDVLVNNAGTCPVRFIPQVSPEDFEKTLRVNLCSMYACSHYAAAYMMEHGGGVIVNAASQASFTQSAGSVEYGTSKWGVRGMTRIMASELARYKIRVVAYAPGRVNTDMMDGIMTKGARAVGMTKEAFTAASSKLIPLRSWQSAEEVAALVSFLVSDEGRNITGQTFMLNGGEVMN